MDDEARDDKEADPLQAPGPDSPSTARFRELCRDMLDAVHWSVADLQFQVTSPNLVAERLDINRSAFSDASSRYSMALTFLAASGAIGVCPMPFCIADGDLVVHRKNWTYLLAPLRPRAPRDRAFDGLEDRRSDPRSIYSLAGLESLSLKQRLFQLSLRRHFPVHDVAFGVCVRTASPNVEAIDLFPVQLRDTPALQEADLWQGLQRFASAMVGRDAVHSRSDSDPLRARRHAVEIVHSAGAFHPASDATRIGGAAPQSGKEPNVSKTLPPPRGALVRTRTSPIDGLPGAEAATRVLLRIDQLARTLAQPRRPREDDVP